MSFNLLSNDLSEEEREESFNTVLEQQVKAESNSRFLLILFSAMFTLFMLVSIIIGMRSNANLGTWMHGVSSNMFLLVLFSILSLSLGFAKYSLLLDLKQFCLSNYEEYTTHAEKIKREFRAHGYSMLGLKVIIASMMTYGISTLFKVDGADSIRIICFISFVIGGFIYSKSAAVRSGFEEL